MMLRKVLASWKRDRGVRSLGGIGGKREEEEGIQGNKKEENSLLIPASTHIQLPPSLPLRPYSLSCPADSLFHSFYSRFPREFFLDEDKGNNLSCTLSSFSPHII